MHHDNIEFWNVAELRNEPYQAGLRILRFPESVRSNIESIHGNLMVKKPCGTEIRFVTECPRNRLYLRNVEGDEKIQIYRGDWLIEEKTLNLGATTCINLDTTIGPFNTHIETMTEERTAGFRFSPDVWRIVLGHCDIYFEGLDTGRYSVRPPKAEELPKVKWLAYGSSITQANLYGYVHIAAQRLGWDLMNKGVAGGCFCEPEMADYLASEDWDIATLELGINMRHCISNEDFAKRARHLIQTLHAQHSGKPILVIDVYENFETGMESPDGKREDEYRASLDTIVEEFKLPGVQRVPATQILDDFQGLSADFLHPTKYGEAAMGLNLAKLLNAALPRKQRHS